MITFYEDFSDSLGRLLKYNTYSATQMAALPNQRHIDIRSFVIANALDLSLDGTEMSELDGTSMQSLDYIPFVNASVTGRLMLSLDGTEMTALDGASMQSLNTSAVQQISENWSTGVVGPISAYNYLNGLQLTCETGMNTTQSIVLPGIDISQLAATDSISLALPGFPLSDLTLGSTYVDFTSDPDGVFSPTTYTVAEIPFATYSSGLTNGDSELRFPVSALEGITTITGVRFRIDATADCTFTCLAIRGITSTWLYAPYDINTMYEWLAPTVPLNGNTSNSFTFPPASGTGTSVNWPILLFSDENGLPAPVNIDLGATIYVSAGGSATDTYDFYLRELPLTGTISDPMPGTLNDLSETTSLVVSLAVDGSSSSLQISSPYGSYSYIDINLLAGTAYRVMISLTDAGIRVRLYALPNRLAVTFTALAFDSTLISDPNLLMRRPGRVGYDVDINNGDAYIADIRPQRTVYGEYESLPLTSTTAMTGARLYTDTSPDIELFSGELVAYNGAIVTPNNAKTTSDGYLIYTPGINGAEGFQTSVILFENWVDTVIEFQIYPTTGLNLNVVLIRNDNVLAFTYPVPPLTDNAWNEVSLALEAVNQTLPTGEYQILMIHDSDVSAQWYISDFSVRLRSVAWSGNVHSTNPADSGQWVKYLDNLNNPTDAAVLGRGQVLQIRGERLTQTASINGVQVLPQYATLGNLIGTTSINALPVNTTVTPSFSWSPASLYTDFTGAEHAAVALNTTITFVASATINNADTSPFGDLYITSYMWNFGDGVTATGQTVTHTFINAYLDTTVTLTVVDNLNRKWFIQYIVYPGGSSVPFTWEDVTGTWSEVLTTWG